MVTILVVDDEVGMRDFMRRSLEPAGYRVVEAKDGNHAMVVFRRERPELVITDIIMPNLDGIDTIAAMKSEYPALKVIAISGGGRAHVMDLLAVAPLAGADLVLSKPFRHSVLLDQVALLMEGKVQ
jgi:CheY-like chemotaxis protein